MAAKKLATAAITVAAGTLTYFSVSKVNREKMDDAETEKRDGNDNPEAFDDVKTEDIVTEEKNDDHDTILVESSKLSYENAKKESKAENSADEAPKLKEFKIEQEVKEEVEKFALGDEKVKDKANSESEQKMSAMDDNQEVNSKEAVEEHVEKSVIEENYDLKAKELKTEDTNKNDTSSSEDDMTEIIENVQAEEKNQAGNEDDSAEERIEAAEFGNVKKPHPFPQSDNEIPSFQDKEDVFTNVDEVDQNKAADISSQATDLDVFLALAGLFLGLTVTSGLVGSFLGWTMDNVVLAGLYGILGLVYISYKFWTK